MLTFKNTGDQVSNKFLKGKGVRRGLRNLHECKIASALVFVVLFVFGLMFSISEISSYSKTDIILRSVNFSTPKDEYGFDSRNVKYQDTMNRLSFPYFGTSKVDIQKHVPLGGGRFMEWKSGDSPYKITSAIKEQSDELARERRAAIKSAMYHAWGGYKKYAFGYDELQPVSGKGNKNWFGLGTTLVDALDTLWLMGMKTEFFEARDWVRDHLNHDVDHLVSTFENTIRSLGGLLSAHAWSGDDIFLEKAEDLGKRLIHAFDSPSGIPYYLVNLKTGKASNANWSPQSTRIATAGSLQLEFRQLSKVTGNETYAKRSDHAMDAILSLMPEDGLYYTAIANTDSKPSLVKVGSRITFGGAADSFYEYLLKLWLQGGRRETKYREAYDKSIDGMHKVLLQHSSPSNLAYLAKKDAASGKLIHEFEHLECFMGGLLALGAYTDPLGQESERARRDMKTAKAITYTCYQMYASTETGLGPEVSSFVEPRKLLRMGASKSFEKNHDFTPKENSSYYLLRPEVVESLYILNKITGDPIYREWGWEIFLSIEHFCRTEYGYGAFKDVRRKDKAPRDNMESFFLGETLKYLFLLFDPDSDVDLNKIVFNTEAHPFPRFDSSMHIN